MQETQEAQELTLAEHIENESCPGCGKSVQLEDAARHEGCHSERCYKQAKEKYDYQNSYQNMYASILSGRNGSSEV